jgi:hypothetical protein
MGRLDHSPGAGPLQCKRPRLACPSMHRMRSMRCFKHAGGRKSDIESMLRLSNIENIGFWPGSTLETSHAAHAAHGLGEPVVVFIAFFHGALPARLGSARLATRSPPSTTPLNHRPDDAGLGLARPRVNRS